MNRKMIEKAYAFKIMKISKNVNERGTPKPLANFMISLLMNTLFL